MTGSILSRAFAVTDGRAAAAFAQPLRRRLVLLLAGHERSVAEMAALMRLDLKYLHYHIGVLQRLGLLMVAHERARPGRPIKVYRAVSKSFFVPGRVTSAGPSAAMHAELRDSLAKVREPSLGGTLYYVDENDAPRMQFIGKPASKPLSATETATEIWQVLTLSRAEALRLTTDIAACLKSCAHRDRGTTQDYLVHFAVAPRLAPKKGRARALRRF
ncbi:MAG TPA: helix-turn-helix domain-containing protein [Steroidobacteraceae bacterium]